MARGVRSNAVQMDFSKRTLAPLLLDWWAEASNDLSPEEVRDAFQRGEILDAFDPVFQRGALRHVTRLFKNDIVYGEWHDVTEGEEADPASSADDFHYQQVGDSVHLRSQDLSGELNEAEEWEECLKCLSFLDVAKNVDGTLGEVGAALGADFDWSAMELLRDVTCTVGGMEGNDVNGLFPPLLLVLGCLIQVKKSEKAEVNKKLRHRARRERTFKIQNDQVLKSGQQLKVTTTFPPKLQALKDLRGRKVK
ncbi:hypothetical protein CYMTET_45368 [Cymbomonas tetramitiformis]|uniref:Uncharacterized protein n=1 Tax=Cymbomonas tetramitiformis TaxID=36881 RepID=A0AAE0BZG3_9CHLO|nr:hypothetical protein CYMTET_45368 [Cymbomonas tetramitiformis]